MIKKNLSKCLEFYTRVHNWYVTLPFSHFGGSGRPVQKYLLKYKNVYTTWTVYILIWSTFSINCVKKYDKLKLNYPDIRPSHVQLREPNYKIKERFHQLDKPTKLEQATYSLFIGTEYRVGKYQNNLCQYHQNIHLKLLEQFEALLQSFESLIYFPYLK